MHTMRYDRVEYIQQEDLNSNTERLLLMFWRAHFWAMFKVIPLKLKPP